MNERERESEMGVYRFTFELVLDIEGESPEDALDNAHNHLAMGDDMPALVDWVELSEEEARDYVGG